MDRLPGRQGGTLRDGVTNPGGFDRALLSRTSHPQPARSPAQILALREVREG
jgi:hypothetical protein